MIATEPLSTAQWATIGLGEREVFSDHRHVVIYGQRTADDRLAFGGRGAPYHYRSRIQPEFDHDSTVFADLRETITDLLPSIEGVRFTHAWGGPLGIARDWHPSVGHDPSTGLGWAGGYVGDGVAASNLAGRTLADLVTGRHTPHRAAVGGAPQPALGGRAAAVGRHQRRPQAGPRCGPRGGPHRSPCPGRPAAQHAHRSLGENRSVSTAPADLSPAALEFVTDQHLATFERAHDALRTALDAPTGPAADEPA